MKYLHHNRTNLIYYSADKPLQDSPTELLILWNISRGEGGLFICGTTWGGDGGLGSDNGAVMVITLSSSVGEGDLLISTSGEGECLGVFLLGDGGLGSKRAGRPEIFEFNKQRNELVRWSSCLCDFGRPCSSQRTSQDWLRRQ